MEVNKIAGVVLAGGASSRMGTSKALLRCGSTTFLDNMAKALIQGGCNPVMAVVSKLSAPVLAGCKLDDVTVIINRDPSLGPISSLRCALKAKADASGLVMVLVDQGQIRSETVRLVREALVKRDVVVARYQGRPGHPTGFSKGMFGLLHSSMADRGAREIVRREQKAGRTYWVDVDDPGVVRNINTKAQYEKFVGEGDIGKPQRKRCVR